MGIFYSERPSQKFSAVGSGCRETQSTSSRRLPNQSRQISQALLGTFQSAHRRQETGFFVSIERWGPASFKPDADVRYNSMTLPPPPWRGDPIPSLVGAFAFSIISAYSSSGIDNAVTAPPAPTEASPLCMTTVLITMFRSNVWLYEKNPMDPEYMPLEQLSKESRSCMDLSFGAPVIEPPGKAALTQSIGLASDFLFPWMVLTKV
ncbi:hypothetical protein GW17_00015573 [Ensete ventricosum]|nr:hypothetical protein GW17_00015573 [Ensete ventricosum]